MAENAEVRTINDVVEQYIQTRDRLDAERKAFKERERELKAEMEVMSMWLLERAEEFGVDSFKTKAGTAYKSTKTFVRVGNWDKFIGFVKETDNFQMLEKRLAKLATQEVLEETGLAPQEIGVDMGSDVDMLVRRN